MEKNSKIYIAGHRGMVGSALTRNLKAHGFTNMVFKTRAELDLCIQKDVDDFFANEKPEYVFLAAAKVGGIHANNTYRADFIYENLMVQNNIIHAAYKNKAKKVKRICQLPTQTHTILRAFLKIELQRSL